MTRRAPKRARTDLIAQALEKAERAVILEQLRKHDGNVRAAAEEIGISRRALEVKMEHHELRDMAAGLREKAGIGGPRGA